MSTLSDIIAVAPSFEGPDWRERERGRVGPRESTAEQTYWVNRAELDDALDLIYPGGVESISIGPTSIVRAIPLQHPDFPGLYADGYEFEVFRSAEEPIEGLFSGPKAKVRIFYRAPEYPYDGDEPFQQVTGRGFLDAVEADNVSFSGGGRPSYVVTRPVPGLRYSLTVYGASAVTPTVEALWAAYQGSVNIAPFRGQPAGTVLFETVDFDNRAGGDGSKASTYTLNFAVRRGAPWNQAYKRDGSLGDLRIGSDPPHPEIDFYELFK